MDDRTKHKDDYQSDLITLLVAVGRRDRRAFKILVDGTSSKVFGVLIAMLRDREAATDALQETYLRVWTRAATYDAGRGNAEAWVIQIARNHAIDLLRSRKRRPQRVDEDLSALLDPAPTAERRAVIAEDVRDLLHCLETLDPPKRDAIRLTYLQGLSYAELADRMGTPLNTVKTWLRRGLIALKDCVDGR